MVVVGGPSLGDIEAGAVASAFSPAVSIISGGIAVLAGVGLVALTNPELWRYRSGPATAGPHAGDAAEAVAEA
jgi:hypothetical protein